MIAFAAVVTWLLVSLRPDIALLIAAIGAVTKTMIFFVGTARSVFGGGNQPDSMDYN